MALKEQDNPVAGTDIGTSPPEKAVGESLGASENPEANADKNTDKKQDFSKISALSVGNGTIGAYAAAKPALDLSHLAWEKEKLAADHPKWHHTPEGRLAIRCFSRGIMGAAFFSMGQRYAGTQMRTYRPDRAPENWVQFIAKAYDKVAGKPIEATVNALGFDGRRAVSFRPTRMFYGGMPGGPQEGRTLGHEVVAVTFDFAAMSCGDAMGRDIASIADPNATLSWMKDGHINYPQAVKSMMMSAFKYLTYNQGEDWAVALPYVYFIRTQRNLINKFSPGFAYDSDRNLNGASFKVNDKGQVTGNYMAEGMFDLQSRFTVYNMGTLMFREAYMEAADKFLKWEESGYKMPAIETPKKGWLAAAVDGMKHLIGWGARDTIKAGIYMTPAVPFFWATRTPQTKWRGLFIHPEKGVMTFKSGPHPWPRDIDTVHANEPGRDTNKLRLEAHRFGPETPVAFSRYNGRNGGWDEHMVRDTLSKDINPHRYGKFDPHADTFGPVDKFFNKIGDLNDDYRRRIRKPLTDFAQRQGFDVTSFRLKRDIDNFANASVSYTPYFYTKTEFAKLWDNGKMDTSIERMLDGVVKLDFGEFSGGISDIGNTIFQRPLSDPAREAAAQERIRNDISPADVFDPQIFKYGHRGDKHGALAKNQMPSEPSRSYVEQERQRRETQPANSPLREPPAPRLSGGFAHHVRSQDGLMDSVVPPGVTLH